MDTKTRDQASACLDGVGALLDEAHNGLFGSTPAAVLTPIRALLDRAETLMNSKDEARAKKNAGDRARRAKKKSPGKKAKRRNPRHPPPKPLPPLGTAT